MKKKILLIIISGLIIFTKADSSHCNCIDVLLNYNINENILQLEFEVTNLCDKPVYFINNLWLFEFADNKYSLDGSKTNIYLNPNNSEENAAKSAAHELFLHFRFFLLMIPSNHETSDKPDWYKKYENQSGE